MRIDYESFVATKLAAVPPTGIAAAHVQYPHLFPFQSDLVTWSLRRGRCAIFADTGLGKTRMQLTWADGVAWYVAKSGMYPPGGGRVLILAPLSVARQTQDEASGIDIIVRRVSEGAECDAPGVYVTNYDKLHRFDAIHFDGVVLDESSIIKHHDAKTLAKLLERFRETPFKLCASATPSPNDYTELGTHAEFLGICKRSEMLAEFFTHDGADTSKWRLKGHARKAFWRWVSTWAAMLRRPSDLGYDDTGYILPTLHVHERIIAATVEQTRAQGTLFAMPASTLTERRQAKRESLSDRVSACVDQVRSEPHEQFVIWCALNDEQDELSRALGDQCTSIAGAQAPAEKEIRYAQWATGTRRVLVTKLAIFGFGINMQHCARMAFVGPGDSWESYYQGVRRIYRFGQRRECHIYIFAHELEGNVLANLKRKEADASKMAEELSAETRDMVRAEVRGLERDTNEYEFGRIVVPDWMTRRDPE